SSRSATFVSCGVVLTIRSLVMEGPFHEPSSGGWTSAARPRGRGRDHAPLRGWRSGSGRRAPWGSVRRAAGPPAPRAAATRRAGSGKGKRLSVREATHPDIENETHGDERGKNGRSAIAHEGQRQSLDGHEARHHGDIVHDLEGEGGRDRRHQEGPHPIARELGRLQ